MVHMEIRGQPYKSVLNFCWRQCLLFLSVVFCIVCVSEHMYVRHVCARALELEVQMVLSSHAGAGANPEPLQEYNCF